MVNCPACDNLDSHGDHRRLASNIQEVCMSKQPESERDNKVEECHAKYDREAFSEHLENKKECIYHRLIREVDKMEQSLANKYGIAESLISISSRIPHHTETCKGSYAERLELCLIS